MSANKIKLGGGKSPIPEMYEQFQTKRNPYLDRAKEYSRMTLPYLMPESTNRSGGDNQHGFQGIGAQATNHLANKLTLTLFPPQRSFFKLEPSDEATVELEEQGFTKTALATHLASIENKTMLVQEQKASRSGMTEAFKQLTVTGNVCLYLPQKKEGLLQAIPLSNYVVKRTLDGQLRSLIILEEKPLEDLEPTVQALIKSNGRHSMKGNEPVKLYTMAKYNDGMFDITQSAFDTPLATKNRIKAEKLPWIPLRWNTCYGEDYGRGLVEDHAGDFFVVELLSEAVAKGMVLMSDIKYLVKQGSTIDLEHLINSPTGEFIYGNLDDIGVLQLDKFADYSKITEVLNEYKRRIGQAFMLQSANRRDAERVTTVELRLDAAELETSLGGIYSQFAQTLQRPLALLYLQHVSLRLGSETLTPIILTGLSALGKSNDLDKISQFSEMMQVPQSWPEPVLARVKWDDYAASVAASLSMSMTWFMSEEEFAESQNSKAEAEQQQAMTAEASKAIPDVIKQQVGG